MSKAPTFNMLVYTGSLFHLFRRRVQLFQSFFLRPLEARKTFARVKHTPDASGDSRAFMESSWRAEWLAYERAYR
ncbi:hypothetical protein [Paenibacillus humicus]|uniref:hypothetical protein n=1 Tax=Paenibacillus humicus TaxID=412861 RepID=UPI000FDAD808|nr:hypothetical protein [Paenibacillus humicus]